MQTEHVHTLVLGAGPSGLAAGYVLAKAGLRPVVLERDKVCGGLMRSVRHGEFILDIGRKELYNRLDKVDRFVHEILGDDYREYPHRGGLLYKGVIVDQSPAYQGMRRGMPWPLFLSCVWDFGWAQLLGRRRHARSLQDYFYHSRGKHLTQVFSQGFQEKLTGRRWAEVMMPTTQGEGAKGEGAVATMKAAFARAFSKKEVNTFKGVWKHPALGSGQISEVLGQKISEFGGTIHYNTRLAEMSASGEKVEAVVAEIGGERVRFEAENVVSSIPIEFLVQYLLNKTVPKDSGSPFRKKTVILVYLFLNEAPRFPQAWLNVTCPEVRVGRITNYSEFNGRMVPPGKTCLCCEYYFFDEDPLLKWTDQQFAEEAMKECTQSRLIDRSKCFEQLVIRLPGADASQNRDNWMNKIRLGFLADLKPFKNLYYVNRTETDIATLAGLEAGEAIISGSRADFDRRIDPAELGIRSESKAFEFKAPAGV